MLILIKRLRHIVATKFVYLLLEVRLHKFNDFLMVLLDNFHSDYWRSLNLFLRVDLRSLTVSGRVPVQEKIYNMEDDQRNTGNFFIYAGNGGVNFENTFQLACLLS